MYALKLFGMILVLAAALIPTGRVQGKQTYPDHNGLPMVLPTRPQTTEGAAQISIFGSDDRFEITDTHHFPWSAVALIRIYWSANDLVGSSCTGWMIGPSAVATAAHCIYENGYADRVVIKPGMNSDDPDSMPFGSCTAIEGIVPDAWIQNKSIEYDYGVYRLDCSIGTKTGTLGFKATSGDWTQKQVQLTGYPNDKPGRTMWSALGMVTSSSAKGFYYDTDMRPGQSGSPVWDNVDGTCELCVVAINSSEFPAPTMNFGARIDKDAFEFLQKESKFQPDPSKYSTDGPDGK